LKFSANRSDLKSAFASLGSVVPAKSPKVALQSVRASLEGSSLTLTATDMEISLTLVVDAADVEGEGVVLLNHAKMVTILGSATAPAVTFDVQAESVQIRSGKGKWTLPTADPDQFPAPVHLDYSRSFVVPAADLALAIKRTAYAADSRGENAKPALTGCLFDLSESSVSLVGCDGRRMAVQDAHLSRDGEPAHPQLPVVPHKALSALGKLLADAEGDVRFAFDSENSVGFSTPTSELWSRLTTGQFPAYRRAFPVEKGPEAIFLVGDMVSAIEQASVTTAVESKSVEFRFSDGSCVLAGYAADSGSSEAECPVAYEGDGVSVKYEPTYLKEALKSLPADSQASLAVCQGGIGWVTLDEFQYLVYPVNVNT
jgi:DNA polymerase III subunit beta